MQRPSITRYTTPTSPTEHTLPPPHQQQNKSAQYALTNFYVPTLHPKKYNPLKLKELVQNTLLQKQNRNFRKRQNIPFRNRSQKLLSKQTSYPSFKPQTLNPHPSFIIPQLINRRTNEFFNCKKASNRHNPSPFLTEDNDSKRFE